MELQGNNLNLGNSNSGTAKGFEAGIELEILSMIQRPSFAQAKNYRRHKGSNPKVRRQLMSLAIESLLIEAKRLIDRGGVITKKTTIVPYRPGSEWDLDASLDKMTAEGTHKLPSYFDIMSRKIIRPKRSFIILADKSNSLGPSIDYLALGVSILVKAASTEEFAVLLFDDGVRTVKGLHQNKDDVDVLEEILDVECFGATNLHQALSEAKKQVDLSDSREDAICLMISDCIRTDGSNPLEMASLLPNLVILLLKNETTFIGRSYADELQALPNVKVKEIKELNDIIDAVQEVVSYGSLEVC